MSNTFKENITNAVFEEAVERYAKDIANQEIKCSMTEEQLRIMEEQKNEIYNNVMNAAKRQKRTNTAWKKVIIVAAVLVIILALALNTSALKLFLYRTYIDIKGTTMNVNTEQTIKETPLQVENFMYKDKVVVPGWLPPDLKLTKLQDFETHISLKYEAGDKWLIIKAKANLDNNSKKDFSLEENVVSVEDVEILGEPGQIIKMLFESGDENYIAVWNTSDIRYEVRTNCNPLAFKIILDDLSTLK